jgi:hypothetical protein
MRFVVCTVFALALLAGQSALAQEEGKCPASCNKSAVGTSAEDCEKCPMTAAMEKLPKIVYKVGDETTCCCQSAKDLADKAGKPIQYLVGDKSFEKEDLAFVALVETTEAFVNEFITPTKCETSGATKIAGESCACPVQAGAKTNLVKAAVEKVKMTYVVGEKESHCPKEAKQLASESNEKITYVVGDAKSCCEWEARLNLAKAQYKAVVEALASKQDASETNASSSADSETSGS